LSEHGKRYRTGQRLARKIVPFSPYVLKFFLFAAPVTALATIFSDGRRMLLVTKQAILIERNV
jgi:hypothetical protein